MSNTVDSRVLEMRFDNKQFEAGIATSMSTLEKLKSKLNLTASSKSLQGLGDAAKKVDMSGLGKGVDSIHTKFSALQVVGVTALANITNSAINAGKRITKALTIEPVTSGLQEYETQINAVQTILANTQKEHTTIKQVNSALDELNLYADKTIYNFTEMTRNIGTFTAAGVDLKTSVNAIQGIANLAAVSGSTSQQASVAMYQLSQALAAGTVKLMDWNSVVNAGMGGQVFQEALRETSEELNTGAEAAIKANGSFRESLQTGWLTSEVLTETLKKFTTSGANEYVAKYTGLSKEAVAAALKEAEARYGEANAIDKAAESLAKKSGKNKQEIKEALQFAKTAEDAATKVKTLTQLWDVLKEAAQSGWAQTWRLIIGDFEEAKALFTPLSEFLTDIINKVSNARNDLLESALGMGFEKLYTSLSKTLKPIKKVADGAKDLTEKVGNVKSSLGDLGKVVDSVIIGKFGNGEERVDKLTKAGENYYKVQNKVNETLGNSFRYTKDQIAAQDKLLASQGKTRNEQGKSAKSASKTEKETTKLTKAQKNQLKELVKMTEEQARANGYTDEQIKALRELRETADSLGIPLDTFIDKMDEINGRWLLLDSFKNIGKSIVKIFSSIGKAYRDVFEPMKPEQLFNAIGAFHKFTSQLIISDKTAENLRKTFRGLFSVIDIITTILGGGFKLAFTVVSSVLKAFNTTFLGFTGMIGDAIYKFNTWLSEHNIITKFIDSLTEKLPALIDKIKEFISSLHIPEASAAAFANIAEGFQAMFEIMHGAISRSLTTGIKLITAVLQLFGTNLLEVGSKVADLVIKFRDWLKENTLLIDGINKIASIIKLVIDAVARFAKAFMQLKPVQDMIEKIKNAFAKLKDKLNFKFTGNGLEKFYNMLKSLFDKIENGIKNLDQSKFFNAGLDIVAGLANGIASGIGKAIDAIVSVGQAIIDKFCSLLGIHSPSVVFMVLGGFIVAGLILGLKAALPGAFDVLSTFAQTVITAIADILQNGIPFIVDFIKTIGSKLFNAFKNFNFTITDLFVAGTLIGILLLIKKALSITEGLVSPVKNLGKLISTFDSTIKSLGVSAEKWIKAKKFEVYSKAILNFAKAIAILAASVFLLSKIELTDLAKAMGAITILVGLLTALILVSSKASGLAGFEFGKLSVILISLGAALVLMSIAVKKMASVDAKAGERAVGEIVILIGAMALLIAAFGLYVKDPAAAANMNKAGTMLLRMSIAIGILALAMKTIAGISWEGLGKGAAVISGIMVFFIIFIQLCQFLDANSKYASKAGTMLLRMAVAIGILAVTMRIIAGLSWGDISKGAAVISGAMALFSGIMVLSRFAGANAAKAGAMFLMMSVAIGILVLTIKAIAKIPDEDIYRSTEIIKEIMKMFAAIMVLSAFAGANAAKAGAMFLMMSAAIAILMVTIRFIASISDEEVNRGMNIIMSIMMLFMSVMLLSNFVGKNADKAGSMFIKMSAAILILVAAIAILSILDPADVIRGTACIGAMLALFAAIMYMSKYVTESYKTILMIAIVIGLLAASLVVLSLLDPDRLAGASVAMGTLMSIFGIVVKLSDQVQSSMGTLIVMTIAIGMIAGALYFIAQLPTESALVAAISLSAVMFAMAASLAIISKAGAITPMAIVAMAAMVVVMGMIAIVLRWMSSYDVNPSIETAVALSTLMLAMSAALVILAAVGAVAAPALIGVGVLLAVVAALGAFIVGIGALFENVQGLEGYLDAGIEILVKLGEGIGRFIGALAGGVLEGVASTLPAVGMQLSAFWMSIQPFVEGIKSVDPSTAEAAKNLATAILAITGAGILDAISKWLTGGSSMESFGNQLVAFGLSMKAYGMAVAGIDAEAITASAQAAKALTEVANALPKEGGIWQALAGVKSIGSFGNQLVAFGLGMKAYSQAVAGIDTGAITASAQAAKGLTEVARSLPKEGGFWQELAGSQDIALFGSKLMLFGVSMKAYGKSVAGIDTEAIVASSKAAKALVKVANSLPKDGGVWQSLAGSKDISSFGTKLKSFGKAMKGYADEVGSINSGAISSSASAAKSIISVVKKTADVDTSGVSKFVKAVKKLGETDMDSVNSAFSNAGSTAKMVKAGVNMIKSVGTGIKSSSGSVKSAAKSAASSISTSFTSQSSSMVRAGSTLISALARGMSSKANMPKSTAKRIASSAATAASGSRNEFFSAGSSAASGFANGISFGSFVAVVAARAMASAAARAAKDALDINSPSKVFMRIAKSVPEGFALGVSRNVGMVVDATKSMGGTAITSMKSALTNVGKVIDSDMDINPTIAPVVDLSNVKSGVGAINGMFDKIMSIGVMADANAINMSMNRRSQNGVNDDVVSAIRDLGNAINDSSGDSYTINGVTYDDGSNITDAVKSIVRAARIERRV